MAEEYILEDGDLILVVAPYSPAQAEEMKASGAISTAARQAVLEKIFNTDGAAEKLECTIQYTAKTFALQAGANEHGHIFFIGPEDAINAAYAYIADKYNSRVFTAAEYQDFMGLSKQARDFENDEDAAGIGVSVLH